MYKAVSIEIIVRIGILESCTLEQSFFFCFFRFVCFIGFFSYCHHSKAIPNPLLASTHTSIHHSTHIFTSPPPLYLYASLIRFPLSLSLSLSLSVCVTVCLTLSLSLSLCLSVCLSLAFMKTLLRWQTA